MKGVDGQPSRMPNQACGGRLPTRPAVAKLLADLTHAGTGAAWPRQATSTASIIDEVRGNDVAPQRLGLRSELV